MKKVFVSGTFDITHQGHITFLMQASEYGDLFVGMGSDYSIEKYKGKKPVYNQDERLFIIKAIRYVKDAWINSGEGQMDWMDDVIELQPDIMVVNEDQDIPQKREFCNRHQIEYIVLKRNTLPGFPVRSTTMLRNAL